MTKFLKRNHSGFHKKKVTLATDKVTDSRAISKKSAAAARSLTSATARGK